MNDFIQTEHFYGFLPKSREGSQHKCLKSLSTL